MTEKKVILITKQIEAEKYLDAIQCLLDEMLKIEVRYNPLEKTAGSDKRKIKMLSEIIEKVREAATFGNEWAEGRRAHKAAIVRLQKMSDPKKTPARAQQVPRS
jgi:hypothetical protein